MRLSALLASLPMHLAPSQWLRSSPSEDPVIRGIAYDSRRVAPGDLFVLCSDGLTGLVRDDEIAEAANSGADLDAICAQLIDLANERGGDDNITVVLVRCEKTGADVA